MSGVLFSIPITAHGIIGPRPTSAPRELWGQPLSTERRLHQLLPVVPAHGLTFDPTTNDIVFNSGNEVDQFDPTSGSAAPFEGAGLNRVLERPAFGAGPTIFALESVVPFCLGVGIVDQGQGRVVAQTLLLAFHDRAVLAQKGAHVMPQKRLQRGQPS